VWLTFHKVAWKIEVTVAVNHFLTNLKKYCIYLLAVTIFCF
jgi:hypothetical protein